MQIIKSSVQLFGQATKVCRTVRQTSLVSTPIAARPLPRSPSPGLLRRYVPTRNAQLSVALLLCCSVFPLPAVEVYDCEILGTNQFLDGQDGWRVQADFGQVDVIPGGIEDNATIVLRHHHTVTSNQSAFATRTNDARFDFVAFSGTETNAIIQFEANVGNTTTLLTVTLETLGDAGFFRVVQP